MYEAELVGQLLYSVEWTASVTLNTSGDINSFQDVLKNDTMVCGLVVLFVRVSRHANYSLGNYQCF